MGLFLILVTSVGYFIMTAIVGAGLVVTVIFLMNVIRQGFRIDEEPPRDSQAK